MDRLTAMPLVVRVIDTGSDLRALCSTGRRSTAKPRRFAVFVEGQLRRSIFGCNAPVQQACRRAIKGGAA